MNVAIFANQEVLDAVPPLPSGVAIGEPIRSTDGRVAIIYGFSEEDLQLLTQEGANILEQLPEDWQYPQSDY